MKLGYGKRKKKASFGKMSSSDNASKSHLPSILIGGLFLAIFLVIALDNPVAKGQFEAVVVGVVQHQSEVPKPSELVIEFDNGQRAKIKRTPKYLPKIGQKIIVQKYERDFLGTGFFSFVKIAESEDAG